MSNMITGAIAVIGAVIFLLYYAFRIESPILWIIIMANLGALIYDFYTSLKDGEDHI